MTESKELVLEVPPLISGIKRQMDGIWKIKRCFDVSRILTGRGGILQSSCPREICLPKA